MTEQKSITMYRGDRDEASPLTGGHLSGSCVLDVNIGPMNNLIGASAEDVPYRVS
jgi:hypothetical protein